MSSTYYVPLPSPECCHVFTILLLHNCEPVLSDSSLIDASDSGSLISNALADHLFFVTTIWYEGEAWNKVLIFALRWWYWSTSTFMSLFTMNWPNHPSLLSSIPWLLEYNMIIYSTMACFGIEFSQRSNSSAVYDCAHPLSIPLRIGKLDTFRSGSNRSASAILHLFRSFFCAPLLKTAVMKCVANWVHLCPFL